MRLSPARPRIRFRTERVFGDFPRAIPIDYGRPRELYRDGGVCPRPVITQCGQKRFDVNSSAKENESKTPWVFIIGSGKRRNSLGIRPNGREKLSIVEESSRQWSCRARTPTNRRPLLVNSVGRVVIIIFHPAVLPPFSGTKNRLYTGENVINGRYEWGEKKKKLNVTGRNK